jgi:hypothetical protein
MVYVFAREGHRLAIPDSMGRASESRECRGLSFV